MKLEGEQEIFYVVSGKGTVTSGGQTSELYDGMGVLAPPGVEFSMKNTGDEDPTMYIINETVPADFTPGTTVLVRDENVQPVRGSTGHWVHIVKNIFTPADRLATLRQTITVTLDPMTIGEPHAHTVGSEEVWIQIKGKSLAFIGTQLRWQTPGMGYLAPPLAEQTREKVTAGLSFPHSNINACTEQVKFLYFQTARRPAAAATGAQPAREINRHRIFQAARSRLGVPSNPKPHPMAHAPFD
jgi:mannose-6-phosphate isomerase-like protein (cupin superfamily)